MVSTGMSGKLRPLENHALSVTAQNAAKALVYVRSKNFMRNHEKEKLSMKTLRQITLATLVTATLSIGAAAQQGSGGCIPGDTQSPPCASAQQVSDQESTDQTISTADSPTSATSEIVANAAVDLVETLLSIF